MGNNKIKLIAELKDDLSGPLSNATGGLGGFSKAAGMAGGAALALGAAVLGAAKKYGDMAAEIRDTAASLNMTTDTVQALNYQFEQTGGGADTFANSMRGVTNFMRTAAAGGAEQTRMLDNLGFSYEQLAAMSPDDQFYAITEALEAMTDEQKKAETAAGFFGTRYSQQVLGTLRQTEGTLRDASAAFQETGLGIPEEDIASLSAFSDKWKELETKFNVMMAEAITPMLPAIESIATALMDAAEEALPALIAGVEDSIPVILLMVDALNEAIKGWGLLLGLGDAQEFKRIDDQLNDLADSLEHGVAYGLITAGEAATELGRAYTYLASDADLSTDQQIALAETVTELGSVFLGAAFGIDMFTRKLNILLGGASQVEGAMETAGRNVLDLIVDLDLINETLFETGDAGESMGTGVAGGSEKAAAAVDALKQSLLDLKVKMLELSEQGAKDLIKDAPDIGKSMAGEAEKVAEVKANAIQNEISMQERLNGMMMQGAQNMAGILLKGGKGWEKQMLATIAKMALQMMAMQIGGPLGAVAGFVGGLFQTGGVVRTAQSGTTVPDSGLYGDRHPYMLERGERVIPREQAQMRDAGRATASNINLTFAPTFSSASKAEMLSSADIIVQALRERGINIG